ncbi:hypothetical protein phiGT1_58 [Sulfitobacter phage phiGT1]|nr:hypothetical protein phiGT1_58 [Sulfitobacter phage phiGT1]
MLETPAEILGQQASSEAVLGFIAWRKATKKPLTERAALLIVKTLRDITGEGGDANEALDIAQERGWLTIKAEWYWRDKQGNGNNGNGTNNTQAGHTHATTSAVTIASRARRTPGPNCF